MNRSICIFAHHCLTRAGKQHDPDDAEECANSVFVELPAELRTQLAVQADLKRSLTSFAVFTAG